MKIHDDLNITTRTSDSELRPAPELGWYDWSTDRARELPPVGETVECCYNSPDEYHPSKSIAHDDGKLVFRWLDGPKAGQVSETSKDLLNTVEYPHPSVRPANYSKRKADLERDKFVKEVGQLLCDTISSMKPDESYYYQYAEALYNAGCRRS